jgi:hypothetical protein
MLEFALLRSQMFKFVRSKERQNHCDAVVLCGVAIDDLANRKFMGGTHVEDRPLDDWLQDFWMLTFQAENKLGIVYTEEGGYEDYPSEVFAA